MRIAPRRSGSLGAIVGSWLALGTITLSAACNEGHKKMAAPPFESKSSAWHELSVPGVTLSLDQEQAAPHRAWGAARIEGDGHDLHGKEAFDATRSRVNGDPVALATLAMLFLDDGVAGKQPWTKPAGGQAPDEQAIARPPALTGDTLVYWRAHAQLADLVRCKLALSAGVVTCELGSDVVQAERTTQDPGGAARQDLASKDVNVRIRGIQALGQAKDAHARDQLIDLALNAYDFRERQAAVDVLGKLGGPGVTAAVSKILLLDQYVEVRQAAASALGMLRDPAGREALQKASTGDANARVQVLASDALKQLR